MMMLQGPVLVGTDLSPDSDEALRQAAALAAESGSRLFVCHVVPELLPDGSVFGEFRNANLAASDSVLARARAAVEQQVSTVLGADTTVDVILESGTAHAGLLRQLDSTGAGLVVTTPGAGALDVARHAHVPVLIVRRSPEGPVVAALDFSDALRPAVKAAAAEAQRRGVALHLVHAFDAGAFALSSASAQAMPYLLGTSPIVLEGLETLEAVAKQRLDATLAELNVAGTTAVITGSAARAIAEYAESHHAALIVVGTHGHSGLTRIALGSTAAAVAQSAPCSVLIVRLQAS